MKKVQWINIFVRDGLLAAVVVWINWTLSYNSWFAAFLMGMIVVMTTWHLSDLIKLNRSLNGLNGHTSNDFSSAGDFYNRIQ